MPRLLRSYTHCRFLLALTLVVGQAFILVQTASAQVAALSPAAERVKADVRKIPIGGELTASMLDGKEYYGNLSSTEAESFTIREVDLKQTLTLRYQDVKQVRQDFGRRGFSGRRIHPHKRLITGLIIVGALLTLVIVAVASDKS